MPRAPGTEGTVRRDRQQRKVSDRRWWPILTPLVGLAVAVSLLFPASRHQWALSLFRQTTYYTVLSFNHPSALPEAVSKKGPITFTFSVSNQERGAVHYQYVLSVTSSNDSYILKKSAKTVAMGATWTVTMTVRPVCSSSLCRVEISLPGHPEKIDFLLNNSTTSDRNGHK